ncbi:MAG TPA: excinuclease ABC subunit UvrC [Methanothrix sp.]|uniref:excinuclease ABC subunit UvrC n=2 Tax=Methanothrix sp. TaxID=90426 RepID=UPI002B9B0970|nr:excinuclease ABC subunit UvrC [Methanothrix sp.]MDI9416916.1 excinuclease ABC subunit UvrC [Euryarchaeota archaeon]HON36427.1 excinuclease ABC subunit UvrC [Methanothrix sp.]HRU75405.1 excinuclease ABC subunit UvrC [Methanothrix sp.]
MVSLDSLPHLPGCYLFRDSPEEWGNIIYVGKARDLKKRVANYFQKQNHSPRMAALVAAIKGVDFIVTNTEVEALLLENTLIKKHQPRYNIKLKDSSRYASIHLTDEQFPRIRISRKGQGQGSFYGPFVSAKERGFVYQIVRKAFGLRTCKRLPKRACLRYHLGHCSGPCIGKISKRDYQARVERAKSALSGRTAELIGSMREEMAIRAGRQDFERAMELRDEINALEHLQERQRVEQNRKYDQDVLSYLIDGESVHLMLFKVYRGTLTGKEEYQFPSSDDFLEEFIVQYYSENEPPEELIVSEAIDGSLVDFLSHLKGKKARVTIPRQGEKRELLLLAEKNLEISVFGDQAKLVSLQEALRLPRKPEVIECFDISHLAGSFAVGSMVQFRKGKPDKTNYRRFRIRDVQGGDDFASIAEVVRRRYSRLKKENKELPDLIVIDGGAGQLSSALKELREMRVKVPIISLAKKEEEIYLPGLNEPLNIKKSERASLYLQEIRDEAHRFALAYNRLLRKKALSE